MSLKARMWSEPVMEVVIAATEAREARNVTLLDPYAPSAVLIVGKRAK